MDYLKNTLKTYVGSFKSRKIPIILLTNLTLILITTALIKLTEIMIQPQIEKINSIDFSNIVAQTEAQLQATISALKGFALFTILSAIILLLLLIIAWSLTQGIIYITLLKKKFSLQYFNKFLLLNVIWLIPWIATALLILFRGRTENYIASISILTLLFLHFSLILYALFTKNNKLSEIKRSLKLGIKKFHYFIIPYMIITITFIIISQLNLLNLHFIIISLVYLLFFSWIQDYLKDITLKLT